MKQLHRALRAAVTEAGYSLDEVRRGVGMKCTYFSHCLNGQSEWTVRNAYAVMDFLGLPHEDFARYFPPGGVSESGKLRVVG